MNLFRPYETNNRTTASASGREPPPSSAPPSAAAFYGLSCDAYDDYDYDEDDNGCCGECLYSYSGSRRR